MRLPHAAPQQGARKAPDAHHKQVARDALRAARGGGATVLLKRGLSAARVARAFNGAVQHAEELHRAYWKRHDSEAGP